MVFSSLCNQQQSTFRTTYFRTYQSKQNLNNRIIKKCLCYAQKLDKPEVKVGWLWDHDALKTEQKLSSLNLKPKQSLGQNFVTDEKVLSTIVKTCNIQPGEIIVEIGPGTGNLTKPILQAGAKVLAIEKDDVLSEGLMTQYAGNKNLFIVNDDIMQVDVRKTVIERMGLESDPGRLKVLANLPYNITTKCLKFMLKQSDLYSELFFMVQDEVAKRLVPEKPEGTGYRAMTVFVHQYSKPNYKFLIKKEKYYPVPKVDGALVQFVLKKEEERTNLENEKQYLQFINLAFTQRRKSLKNSAQSMYKSEIIIEALEQCGIDPKARVQELDFAQTHQVFAKAMQLHEQSKQQNQTSEATLQ